MIPTLLQSAFLWGSAALAVPILIHLFFRLRTKRVELGTIRFLRVVLEENARRRRVMRWLLLALRMAFVGLLVVLFGRPYFTSAAATRQQKLLTILIDRSATMQLKGERGRLFDQALNQARQLAAQAGPRTRVEVALFDHRVEPLTSGRSEDGGVDKLLASAAGTTMLYGATNYGAAFAWARDRLVNEEAAVEELHLFTDLQRSGLDWSGVEPLPGNVQAFLHDLGRQVGNVAVTELRLPRTWIRPGEATSVRATITHGGSFTLDEVPVLLEIGRVHAGTILPRKEARTAAATAADVGQRVDFARLEDRITKRERVKLEPGATVLVDFDLPPLDEGIWQGRVVVEHDDDLAFDNQRYLAVAAAPAYRVLVVKNGTKEGPTSETYFLEAALRLAPSGETSRESPFAPDVMSAATGERLPDLAAYSAVILANIENLPASDARRLAEFVRDGGGLLVFTGDRLSAQGCATLASEELTVGQIESPVVTQDLPWRIGQWNAEHPVFEPLSDPQHGDLRRWIFAAYTRIQPDDGTEVIAQFRTGDPAVLEKRLGAGTVLWVTTSCGRAWGDWCTSRLFLPIVHQLLAHEVGLALGGRVRSRLIDADPAERLSDLGADHEGATLRSRDAAHAGRQATPGVVHLPRYSETINTSPRESDAEPCDREEFEKRFGVRFVDENHGELASPPPESAAVQRDEFWHWIACGLLGVILLEGFVGNRTTA